MANNVVVLIGRLGKDPEVKEVTPGVKKAQLSLGVDDSYKKPNGEKVNSTNWFTVIAWRKLAEIIESYGKKGQLVSISGKLDSRVWDDENNNKKYVVEVVAESFKILSAKNEG